ncbi:MAG: Mut7-C RNAse domain-containing protein [Acidobacteriota bacterium]
MRQGSQPRFLLDVMLGSLARWLRLLGYDTLYFNEGEDSVLLSRARARRRLLVTRDRELAGRRDAKGVILLRSRQLCRQWSELVVACNLRPDRNRLMTRCGDCNTRIVPLSREAARRRVPPYVHATRRRFRRCPTCDRVFWRATHVTGIASRLEKFLQAARLSRAHAATGRRARRLP